MENSTVLGWLGVLLLVSVVGTGFAWSASNNEVEATVDFTDVNSKLDTLANGIVALEGKISTLESKEPAVVGEDGEVVPVVPSGDYIRNQAEYENDLAEAEALKLAEESVNLDDRDFLRALYNALVAYNISIDDRDDITSIKYDTDVDLDGDDAEVEFEKFRVWYIVDGDEEETEKAKINDFTVLVGDLDYDDEFDDSEVNEDYMGDLLVNKVYD